MIQAQVEREVTRERMTREEFLETLEVRIRLFPVTSVTDPRFPRAFELIKQIKPVQYHRPALEAGRVPGGFRCEPVVLGV